ncbi:MAG TPA: hypothetical protein P5318_17000 [Candidatus Hydrogenedentes bacterium]|nr:hypothetical protein [Candidatus Hydrogenedentota bacterium]HPC17946.1 hypothetical protein [Candidatus Hydrogenedentota bacterium]HRT21815.1 hypothetical protein [Candidatus Hydrogenedentota bacterium]HRT63273.1 hypothetical protein [Candidatus Hydrogenedentota bacterium]
MKRIRFALMYMLAMAPLMGYAEGVTMEEKVSYGGWPNCVKLTNGRIELIATTDIGPRLIRFGFTGGQNLFKEYEKTLGMTGGSEWRNYGGHRLWHAPEEMPRTYWPDNDPVKYTFDGKTLKLVPKPETGNGVQKEIEVTMDPKENKVAILHRIINLNLWEIELAPWALSVMAPGGRAIFPQEEFRRHEDYLLPARPVVLWHYTQMADPRWTWGNKYIQLRQDPGAKTKQKIGFLNKQGWAAYLLKDDLFIKQFAIDANAKYPDYGCNTETFTDWDMLEVETLGPMTKLAAGGGKVEHTEIWTLNKVELGEDEAEIDSKLLPLLKK